MRIEIPNFTKEMNLDDLFQTKTEERIVDVYIYDENGIPRFFARRTNGRDFFEFRQNLESKGYKIHSTNFISTEKTEVYFEQPEFIELPKFTTVYDEHATKEENDAAWQLLLDTYDKDFQELIADGYTMRQINQIMKERTK